MSPMKKLLARLLPSLAVGTLLYSGAALAGIKNAAGTMLGDGAGGMGEVAPVIVLVAVAAVVIYLMRRKSK